MTVTSRSNTGSARFAAGPRPTNGTLWLAVAEYAVDRANRGGVLLLDAGQLRRDLADQLGRPTLTTSEVSRAIRGAIAYGWLAHRSNTRTLLVMPTKRRGGTR